MYAENLKYVWGGWKQTNISLHVSLVPVQKYESEKKMMIHVSHLHCQCLLASLHIHIHNHTIHATYYVVLKSTWWRITLHMIPFIHLHWIYLRAFSYKLYAVRCINWTVRKIQRFTTGRVRFVCEAISLEGGWLAAKHERWHTYSGSSRRKWNSYIRTMFCMTEFQHRLLLIALALECDVMFECWTIKKRIRTNENL